MALYDAAPTPDSPDLRAITAAALTTATAAGATYADVQITVTHRELIRFTPRQVQVDRFDRLPLDVYCYERYGIPGPARSTVVGIGVRALVRGYWGFAGFDGIPTTDIAATLGTTAATQAQYAARGPARSVELAPTPVVTGTWAMPGVDPFTVPLSEKLDVAGALADAVCETPYGVEISCDLQLQTEMRTFASSAGSATTQTTYCIGADCNISALKDQAIDGVVRTADFMTPAGIGWDVWCAGLDEQARTLVDHTASMQTLVNTWRRGEPGRYDVVFNAYATARLLDETLGAATELDRAMGYLANTLGTSYLHDPVAMLGIEHVAAPAITVTANRNMPGGAATVRWDDEGVVPRDIALVTNGVLTDFQTTRESSSWLAPVYARLGRPVISNGCAYAAGARMPLTQRRPNLVLQPGTATQSFEDLVKSTKKGVAVIGGTCSGDMQALNGMGKPEFVFEIVDGQLTRSLGDFQYIYRAPEVWRNVVALGGPDSARSFGFVHTRDASDTSRGDRGTSAAHSVSAVPMKVANVAFTTIL